MSQGLFTIKTIKLSSIDLSYFFKTSSFLLHSLERDEGEYMMTECLFWVNYPFKKLLIDMITLLLYLSGHHFTSYIFVKDGSHRT